MNQFQSCFPDESGVDLNQDQVLMFQGVYISGIEISHKLSHSWICDNNGTFWYLLKDIREIFRKFLMVNVRFITKLWKLTIKTVYQTEGMNTYVCPTQLAQLGSSWYLSWSFMQPWLNYGQNVVKLSEISA